MTVFRYRARTSTGEPVEGEITAGARQAAVAALQEQGLFLNSLEAVPVASPAVERPADAPGWRGLVTRISLRDRSAFWRQGAQAQRAGFEASRMLRTWSIGCRGALARFAGESAETAASGTPLSALMRGRPELFGALEYGLIRAGEADGRLDARMDRLAEHFERELRLRLMLLPKLAYLGCLGVVFLLSTFCVAVIAPALMRQEPITAAMVLTRLLFPAAAVIAALVASRVALTTSRPLRRSLDRLMINLPMVGKVLRKLAVSRFANALSELIGAGLPPGEAVELAAGTAGNRHLVDRLAAAAGPVRTGTPLSAALRATGMLPPQVLEMVATGEEAGTTEEMLAKSAEYLEGEATAAAAVLVVLGTGVVFLIIALAAGALILKGALGYVGMLNQLME